MSQSEQVLLSIQSNNLTYFTAASAGVAQAVAFGAQNAVEEARNQSIIKTTAMGTAYAKWLGNPEAGGASIKPILESIHQGSTSQQLPGTLNQYLGMTLTPNNFTNKESN